MKRDITLLCISNESWIRSAYLEMLSNGTIDDFFLSVSEEAQKLMNTSFSAIINDGSYSDV
jgi:hypothetical protein